MTSLIFIPEGETLEAREPSPNQSGCASDPESTSWNSCGLVRETVRRNASCDTLSDAEDDADTAPSPAPDIRPGLIRVPSGTLPDERIEVLQQWEGVVDELTDDSFFAQLHDLGREPSGVEIVEIPLDEVPPDDRPLVVEGALFYLSVGYETSTGGQLRRVSEIRFQRTPRWTKRALERAKLRAEKLFEFHGQRLQASSGQ